MVNDVEEEFLLLPIGKGDRKLLACYMAARWRYLAKWAEARFSNSVADNDGSQPFDSWDECEQHARAWDRWGNQ